MELTRLKGIGPKIAARLRDTEIRTAADLLMLVPRRYEGRAAAIPIGEIGTASSATVIGTIVGAGTPWRTGRGQRFAQVKLRDDTGEITAIFFGAPARGVRQIFTPGRRVQFSGDVKIVKGLPVLQHPDYVLLDADVRGGGEEIFPVYARVAGFGRKQLTSFIRAALDCSAGKLTDALPYEMEPFAGLPPIGDALRQIHAPSPDTDINSLNQFKTPAHRRMILDELFFVQLGLLMRRNIGRRGRAEPMREIGAMEKSVRAALPYRLTNAQEAVLSRIKSGSGGAAADAPFAPRRCRVRENDRRLSRRLHGGGKRRAIRTHGADGNTGAPALREPQ
ncbi:MAG: OB-fold nucleic acid binding domain-containing protein [Deltaproteobacteria bacterium]|nr:OB-fold nucleic acid binding domain-containing protein [Deltaproteobacteria bacterium]